MFSSIAFQLLLYLLSFVFVWIGAGLVVPTISDLSKTWKIPRFILSFFLLGILTSLPEITISSVAVADNDPAIVVGTLLGGVIVMFLGVIPLLGIVGNGIKIPTQLNKKTLLLTIAVVIVPALLTGDQRIERWEALLCILLYLFLLVYFSTMRSVTSVVESQRIHKKKKVSKLLATVVLGVLLLIGASYQIVASTILFADILGISPFFVSLIVVALGTNIPEISLIFRSVLTKKNDIAFADYLGSASANTLLMGFFVLLYGNTVFLPNHFLQRTMFLGIGLILFFFFARSKNTISRAESAFLLLLYIIFVCFEIVFVL